MTTYWVTGKRSLDNSGGGREETLNPFQRSRQPLEQLRPTSAPLPTYPPYPPSLALQEFLMTPAPRTVRMFAPKPDEWPQADRRLSRNEHEGGRQRSATISVIGMDTIGNQHGSIIPIQAPQQPQQAEATANLWSRSSVCSDQPLPNPVRSMSEFNILHVRTDISRTLPTIAEASTPLAINPKQQEMVSL